MPKQKKVVFLGDSTLDNYHWVGPNETVADLLNESLGATYHVVDLSNDGFTTADVFSGGAAFVCAGITLVPTMTQWGLFLFGMAMLTLGLVFVYNKQRQFA